MIFILSPLGQARPSLGLEASGFREEEPKGPKLKARPDRPLSLLFPPSRPLNQSNWEWPQLELEGAWELEWLCVEAEAWLDGADAEVDEDPQVAAGEWDDGDEEAVAIDDCIMAVEDDDDESDASVEGDGLIEL